jgi:3-hydroxybutyryl-CoA dehydrogenase
MSRPGGSVVVIGAGTMGRGIATVAVQAGHDTTIVDTDPAALDRACAEVERRVSRNARSAEQPADPGRLRTERELRLAVPAASTIVEAVPEVESIKLGLFRDLAALADPDALIASHTSTMSVSKLAEACANSARVIGMHFFNPVHRMKLVEIVVGDATSPETVADARSLAASFGKEAVLVRDVPGFITSRLGLLLGNEAMRIVEDGAASAADVDKAMRLGYGHPMGPLELADLVGLDARRNNLRSMLARSGDPAYAVPSILDQLVEAGRLGKKSGAGFYDYDGDGRAVLDGEVRR